MTKIEYWRMKRGMTQTALSARSGVSLGTINRIERHGRKPFGVTVGKLAEALGVDPLVLLGEDTPKQTISIPLPPTPVPSSPYTRATKIPCSVCEKIFHPTPAQYAGYVRKERVFHSVVCAETPPDTVPCATCGSPIGLDDSQKDEWRRYGRSDFYDSYACTPANFDPVLGPRSLHRGAHCYVSGCGRFCVFRCVRFGNEDGYSCYKHGAAYQKPYGSMCVPL